MRHYEKMTPDQRGNCTPKVQRAKVYKFIEEYIKKDELSEMEKITLSQMLDDLAKIHNEVSTIEIKRLTSALTEKNIQISDLTLEVKKLRNNGQNKVTNRPKYDPNTFNSDFLKRGN